MRRVPKKQAKANRSKQAESARGTHSPDVGAKQAILDAALVVFARDGFEGGSLPKIARRANVAHPLIHYYFGSKEELWRAVIEYAFGDMVAQSGTLDTALRGQSPLERLRALIRSFTLNAARHPDHFGIIMTEARSDSGRLEWLRANYTGVFYQRLLNVLKDAQDQNQIREMPLDHLSSILLGAMLMYFTLSFRRAKGVSIDALAEQHANWVVEIVLNGISTE